MERSADKRLMTLGSVATPMRRKGVAAATATVTLALTLSSTALLTSVACRASYPASPTASVVAMRVHYGSASNLPVGATFVVRAYTITSDGAYSDVSSTTSWRSSDPTVVRMATATSFRTVGEGTATIVGVYQDLTDALTITVTPTTVSYPHLQLIAAPPPRVGATSTARAVFHTSPTTSVDVSTTAEWTSSDPAIATVDRGVVRGIRPGTVTITASSNGLSHHFGLSVPPRS